MAEGLAKSKSNTETWHVSSWWLNLPVLGPEPICSIGPVMVRPGKVTCNSCSFSYAFAPLKSQSPHPGNRLIRTINHLIILIENLKWSSGIHNIFGLQRQSRGWLFENESFLCTRSKLHVYYSCVAWTVEKTFNKLNLSREICYGSSSVFICNCGQGVSRSLVDCGVQYAIKTPSFTPILILNAFPLQNASHEVRSHDHVNFSICVHATRMPRSWKRHCVNW